MNQTDYKTLFWPTHPANNIDQKHDYNVSDPTTVLSHKLMGITFWLFYMVFPLVKMLAVLYLNSKCSGITKMQIVELFLGSRSLF